MRASVCLLVARCRPSPPLIMLITQTCWTVFTLGTDCCSFSFVPFTTTPSLYSTDTPLSPSFSLINPPPPSLSGLSPSALHSSPEAMGEGERERERQDRPALLKTLFTPGTKQHVISALGETLTRVGKEWREAVGTGRRDGQAGSQAELKPQQGHDRIS